MKREEIKIMTKKEALKEFEECSTCFCQECHRIKPDIDKDELAYAWSLFVDGLHRDHRITDKQYNEWTNPF